MLPSLILALILGICAGTLTGLIPGIHINLISVFLISMSALLLTITQPIILITFIVAMAITHTFIDFIPSIFLGAPEEDTFLSILPGHKLLLMGRGYYAIIFTLYGSLASIIIISILSPIFIYTLPIIYPYILRIMPIILILISGYLILKENKKLSALTIFLLAGILGIASLNLNLKEPLLPLLTGLFGAGNLIISLNQKIKIPEQKISPIKHIRLREKSIAKAAFASIIASPFTAFLPGLGSSQAAVIGKDVLEIKDNREFLFLIGSINTIVMGLSFITLYAIQKSRTGAAVAISELIPELTFSNILIIIAVIILSGIISFILAVILSKQIAKTIHKFNYSRLSLIILIILTTLTVYFTGIIGLIIFITSAFLGVSAISINVRRIHLMGALIIPTILFYL